MRQLCLLQMYFEKYSKKTHKEVFLEEMGRIILWKALSKAINRY